PVVVGREKEGTCGGPPLEGSASPDGGLPTLAERSMERRGAVRRGPGGVEKRCVWVAMLGLPLEEGGVANAGNFCTTGDPLLRRIADPAFVCIIFQSFFYILFYFSYFLFLFFPILFFCTQSARKEGFAIR